MNILVLNGSPRKEASLTLGLAKDFVDGFAARRRDVQVDWVHLYDAEVGPCRGCFACWKGDAGRCVLRDDMDSILPRFATADLVVWSMPLYHYGMPSGMKAFLERTLPLNRGEIVEDGTGGYTHPERSGPAAPRAGVRHLLISSCGFPSTVHNYEALLAHFGMIADGGAWDSILCVQGELLGIGALKETCRPYRDAVRSAGEAWGALAAAGLPLRPFAELEGGKDLRAALERPFVPVDAFLKMAAVHWDGPLVHRDGPGAHEDDSAVKATPSAADRLRAADVFFRQMGALFNPAKAPAGRTLLEIALEDLGESWTFAMEGGSCAVARGKPAERPATTIRTKFSVWLDIAEGRLDGARAMADGLYSAAGDMKLMIALADGLFGGPEETAATPAEKPAAKGLSMAWALLPWIAGWTLLPFSRFVPSEITLGVLPALAAAVAFASGARSAKPTFFERANPLVLGAVALLLAAFPSLRDAWAAPALYLASALLWGGSLLVDPLSADYSRRDYPAGLHRDRIFLETNAVVCAVWAAVFAVQGIAFVLFGRDPVLKPLMGAAMAVLLLPAGIFNKRFPPWYAARRMAGK